MPKAITGRGPQHVTETIRDAHDESGTVYVKSTIHDDHILENNKRHRLDGTLKPGAPIGLLDGGEVIYHIQVAPKLWARFKRTHKALVRQLFSREQFERERAAATLFEIHPEWFTTAPGNHIF